VTAGALAISSKRNSSSVEHAYKETGEIARERGVRVIYRNNHYNQKFGIKCADESVEKMVLRSGWEIYDTTSVSKDVYKHQLTDNLVHFDRRFVHTVEEHKALINRALNSSEPIKGQLEMQIAQGLLNFLFLDAIANLPVCSRKKSPLSASNGSRKEHCIILDDHFMV
jgi:hypothetical protein